MKYIVKRKAIWGLEKGEFDSLDEASRIKELLEKEGETVIVENENGETI